MTKRNDWTPGELASIRAGWLALEHFCDTTNHSDRFQLAAALKQERKDLGDSADILFARARICEFWLDGYETPNQPMSAKAYFMRDGLLKALCLGVRHAVERSCYNSERLADVAAACQLAIDAKESSEARRRAAIKGV